MQAGEAVYAFTLSTLPAALSLANASRTFRAADAPEIFSAFASSFARCDCAAAWGFFWAARVLPCDEGIRTPLSGLGVEGPRAAIVYAACAAAATAVAAESELPLAAPELLLGAC
jgi:hypothetical protein